MSYPILYQAGETNFNHLGLGILKDTISAVVSEDLNGKFELDLVYAYNNRLSKFLLSGNIIKVDAGNTLKEQLFTIGQVSKTLDGKISVHAEHVSYIMQDLTLKPKTVVYQQDAQNALKQLLNAIKETDHGFTVVSDVSTINSSTWSVPDFKTPRDVLAGVRGSILDNWGGEYKFDNRRISLLKQRGSYANTVIAYGRNLLDFEQETSILETYTSIYPVVVKTEKDVEITHTLPELAVDSQYLDKYANRKTLLVDFSDKFDDKNPYSDDKMRVLANAYIKANKVGIPKVTMTIKTLDLAKMVTEDYKAGKVERLDLADTVKVYFDRLGITTEAKVVGIKWNVLKESYDEYVLGERKATFGTVIRGSIAEVKAVADDAKKNAITALVSADSKNTNYYGNSSDGEPTNPKKGDIWFVKDGDKTIIKTWNGSSWVDLVSSDWQEVFEEKLTEELTKAKVELDAALLEKDKALAGLDKKIADELVIIDDSIAQAKSDVVDAKTRADDAVDKANANVKAIEANAQLIDDVNAIANTAKSQAQTADTNAQTALTSANTAITNANKAISDAGKLGENVESLSALATTAENNANTALTNARNAINQITQLNSDLEDTDGQVSTLTDNLNGFKQTVYTKTQTDTKIATVQSDVNGFKTSVSNTYATKSEIQGIKAGVRNYICEVAWTTKGYLATNGSVTNSNDNLVSSFIDVYASKAWIFQQFESATSGSVYVAFYDTNKNLVGSRVTLADGQTGTTASNVTYMRLSTPYKDTFGGRYKLEFGTVKSDWTQAPEDTQFIYTNLQTQVDQTANAVSSKADKTTVDLIAGRVDTAEGSITTMAGQINLKANQSTVDTITNRVSETEASLSLQDGKITTLTTKTNGFGTSLSSLTQDYNGFKVDVYTKSQTDTKVSTVQQSVDNFKTTVSNTYSSKSETDSKVTAVQANVDKIGNYTAYANSADGTDGFTTVYPGENLLAGTADYSYGDKGANTVVLTGDDGYNGHAVIKTTISPSALSFIDSWRYRVPKALEAGTYTLSFKAKSSIDGATITSYFYSPNTTISSENSQGFKRTINDGTSNFTLTTEWKTYWIIWKQSEAASPKTVILARIFKGDVPIDLYITEPKFESGINHDYIYTPAPSEDPLGAIPKYVGYSARQSENPKDFSWQPYSGLNSYNIIKATTSIEQNSKDIALKANKSEVDTLSGKVTSAEGSISTMAGQIKLKANQTDVDTVKGRVTSAEGSISLISGQVALKANQADVNTTNGKVSSLESSFTVQSGQISALNTKTDGHTTQIGTLESSYSGLTSTISKIQTDVGGKAGKTELSQLSQDLSGFKTTVASTYADKDSVASQINQSATAVTSNVQTWTNNKLTAYSTTQQTATSITNAVADKADKTQITQLSNQITSTVTGLTEDSMITVDMIKDANTKLPDYPDMIVLGIPATIGETYTVSTNKPNRGTESDPIADIFYTQAWNEPPSSPSNGAWSGHSVTTKAVINLIYLVFRDANFLSSFVNGDYWVKLIAAPASQSQITQLVDDINIRVKNSEIVNQINLSKEGILIAGSKVQITGQTYIENGVITSAKIQDLSASKLIAGRIDASIIVVDNINANRITVGTLSADRIAANSITSTHISVSSLSALSANLGTVTAGTINAATVNIININAGSITTGVLNADRIGANSITADKIKATSLDLFNNDTYTNIRADGMRIQSKAQIVFGNWRDSSNTLRTTQGVYIGGVGGGTKHLAFTRSNGTTFMLRAEQGMDYGTNQNVRIDLLNIYDSTQFWESINVKRDIITSGYIAMGGAVQESSIQYDSSGGTMNFRVPGGRSGSYFWFNQRAISEGSFDSRSKLSLKNVKGDYKGNALDDIVNTNIVEYSYKNDPQRRQLSPIIDDINEIKKYHLPDIINDGESVSLYAMGSLSWLAIKQLAQKLENIEEKLDAIA